MLVYSLKFIQKLERFEISATHKVFTIKIFDIHENALDEVGYCINEPKMY